FDKSGKYMYFLASTDAGPVKNWFALSNQESRITSSIYLAVLRKDDPSPLMKESDEEKGSSRDEKKDDAQDAKKDDKKIDAVGSAVIDFEDLSNRIIALPVPPGEYESLKTGGEGQVYYLKTTDGKKSLQRFDLKTRKSDTFVADADEYDLSFDTKKAL